MDFTSREGHIFLPWCVCACVFDDTCPSSNQDQRHVLDFQSSAPSVYFSCLMSLSVRRCWLRLDTYFIWSFIGPATLIIMVRHVRPRDLHTSHV